MNTFIQRYREPLNYKYDVMSNRLLYSFLAFSIHYYYFVQPTDQLSNAEFSGGDDVRVKAIQEKEMILNATN